MKAVINYEITGCHDCPYLTKGLTYGNDGRDGVIVYKCEKGAFGGEDEYGSFGFDTKPTIPPYKCPFLKYPAEERVAARLNVDYKKFKQILAQECVEIKELNYLNDLL